MTTATATNQKWRVWAGSIPPRVVIVGVGGTGGFVADGLCRLLGDTPADIILVDPDRVEPHNLGRQMFYPGDEGAYKAEALAERLTRLYGREILYVTDKYTEEVAQTIQPRHGFSSIGPISLMIGCVDNPAARRAISDWRLPHSWWIDAGNSEHSGQVIIGNVNEDERDEVRNSFYTGDSTFVALPCPVWQEPSLLTTIRDERPMDCAERIEVGDQSPVINQQMAALVLQATEQLFTGNLSWMRAYVDLDNGTMTYVDATPANVARVVGLTKQQITTKDGTTIPFKVGASAPPVCECGTRHTRRGHE